MHYFILIQQKKLYMHIFRRLQWEITAYVIPFHRPSDVFVYIPKLFLHIPVALVYVHLPDDSHHYRPQMSRLWAIPQETHIVQHLQIHLNFLLPWRWYHSMFESHNCSHHLYSGVYCYSKWCRHYDLRVSYQLSSKRCRARPPPKWGRAKKPEIIPNRTSIVISNGLHLFDVIYEVLLYHIFGVSKCDEHGHLSVPLD